MRQHPFGFSLVELMITVVVVGVLAAIAIPSYQRYVYRSKTVDLLNAVHQGQLLVEEYYATTEENNCRYMAQTHQNIPFSSPNIYSAQIIVVSDFNSTNNGESCAIEVVGNPPAFGEVVAPPGGLMQYFDAREPIPSVELISNSFDLNTMPYLKLVIEVAITPVFHSVPTLDANRGVSWILYSNGSPYAPSGLPLYSSGNVNGGGGLGGGGRGGGEPLT